MIRRTNKACKYFPCHTELEDCTFCYCPFYPCGDKSLGIYIVTKDKRKVWSCQDCNWIHKRRVVDRIFKAIKSGGIAPKGALKLYQKDIGVIILAHGSKRGAAKRSVNNIVKTVKERFGIRQIEPAYLQLCGPSLPKAAVSLVKKGCRRIIVVPYFLFNGNHMAKDIPGAIARQKRAHPGIEFVLTRNLSGDEEAMGAIVAKRIEGGIL